ncbi:MAG: tyrosine-type recombinase/integrase [Litorimonas sp.]
MAVKKRNPNHPKKGSSIKVEPIRHLEDIQAIKALLSDNPRDLCMFTFGINTAYRAGEILSLKVGHVAHLNVGDRLDLKQSKSGRYRAITLNRTVVESMERWLAVHPHASPDSPLFRSQRSGSALTVSAANHKMKSWCADIGLKGNYGTHTMRKTWGYHQRVQNNRPVALLMAAFGHTSEKQTLEYLCIQDGEIRDLYEMEL